MKKSITVHHKKRGRGRPATGRDPAVTARIPPETLERVAKWSEANDCSRSEAIVQLIERGLAAEANVAKSKGGK
jgi:hypothetical protein